MLVKITDIGEEDGYYSGMQARDIYLKKDNNIIGLHAIGHPDSEWTEEAIDGTRTQKHGFNAMEQWGNEYDENHKMLGRGSFRVFEPIEELAKKFEDDGWIVYEGPTVK